MYITNYYDCTHNMKVCQYGYKKGPTENCKSFCAGAVGGT